MNKKNNNTLEIFKPIFICFILQIIVSFVYSSLSGNFKNTSLLELLTNIIGLIIIFCIFRKDIIKDLKDIKNHKFKELRKIYLISLIFLGLEIISNLVLFNVLRNISSNETLVRNDFFKNPSISLINAILLAPFLEELIYRFPYKNAQINNTFKYIIYSFMFACAHLLTSTTLIELLYFIPYMFLSLSIGYSYYKTNNIFFSLFAHIFNNTLAIILLLI